MDALLKIGALPRPDYTDERVRAAAAHWALMLNDTWPDSPYVKKAFELFGLDPLDPFHWRELLGQFARAHFKKVGGAGAPKKWDATHLLGLGLWAIRIEKDHPQWLQEDICKEIKKRSPPFKNMKVATMQRRLPEARRKAEAYLAWQRKH
jgi:hypothetical protein